MQPFLETETETGEEDETSRSPPLPPAVDQVIPRRAIEGSRTLSLLVAGVADPKITLARSAQNSQGSRRRMVGKSLGIIRKRMKFAQESRYVFESCCYPTLGVIRRIPGDFASMADDINAASALSGAVVE